MRRALAVTVLSLLFVRTASADEATVGKGRSSVAPVTKGGLTRVGATKGTATATAGPAREVTVRAVPDKKVERPLATQRVLRRMNAERMSFTTEMQTCANEVGTSAPTTVILRLSVTPEGAVEHVELATPTAQATAPATAPAPAQPLIDCVVGAVSNARFRAPGGAGATVALRVEVPAAAKPSIATAEPSTTTKPTGDTRTAER